MMYANGPVNGLCDIENCTVDGWTLNFGYAVSDSFPIQVNLTGFQFAVWAYPGDTLQTVDFSVASTPFGGTQTTVNVSSVFQYSNQYGYDIDVVTVSGLDVALASGTYWLTLQNAVTAQGNPIYWDENSGPSQAQESSLGTIPSESFNVEGGTYPDCFTDLPQDGFTILHSFSNQRDGGFATGVVSDRAGNLYGTTNDWDGDGPGAAFKLAPEGSGWLFDLLYSFAGGSQGSSPSTLSLGLDDRPYGTAAGGINNCGYSSCGLVFSIQPPPAACSSTMCGWQESPVYEFTGLSDAWGPYGVTFDRAGNIYGASEGGGAYTGGAIFELTPSGGSWTESILYSFTGGSDGKFPYEVLVGNDGNLYGLAYGVANQQIFKLVHSAGAWTESVLYTFQDPYFGPFNLIQDSAGNLFGIASDSVNDHPGSIVFELSPSNGTWLYQVIAYTLETYQEMDTFNNLTFDAAGNLWGTGGGGDCCRGNNCSQHKKTASGAVRPSDCINDFGYIFKLDANNGWSQNQPFLIGKTFWGEGPLAMDANGNLYGATQACGDFNQGTVWQYSTSQGLAGLGRRR